MIVLFLIGLLGLSVPSEGLEKRKCDISEDIRKGEIKDWIFQRIEEDLAPFVSSGITNAMLEETMKEDRGLVWYRIKENALSIVKKTPSCESHALQVRIKFMTEIFSCLCKSVQMPDVQFIVGLNDSVEGRDKGAPVFAFAAERGAERVVLIPDFEILMGQEDLLKQVKEGRKKYPWDKKKSQGYWRGATTGEDIVTEGNFLCLPRARAVIASLQDPDLLDVRFTALVQSNNSKAIKKKFSSYFDKSTPVEKHLKYKYQLLIDGNSCAYSRAYWQLFSGCLILKQESSSIQWYYDAILPYVHYVPVENDMGDVKEKIIWARNHDLEILEIVKNAENFARDNLKQSDAFFYLYQLLLRYSLI